MDRRPWIAFFSQTGSEIVQVSKALGREPDLIITNDRPDHLRKISEEIELCYLLPNKPILSDYEHVLSAFDNPLVTLHGWLRVMPEEVCNEYEIYNGHPGLITKYPALKGKDPQKRAWEGCYPTAGCVIHKVTPGVDEGEVLMERESVNKQLPLNELFHILHDTSVSMWVEFLKNKL